MGEDQTKKQLLKQVAEAHKRIAELERHIAVRGSKAEEALRKAEEKFRNLFLNATEGIFQTTPEGRFVSAYPALAHMLGYNSPKLLMTQVTDLGKQIITEPDIRQAYLSVLNQTGVLKDFECKMRKADGTIIWGSINAHTVRDKHGRVLH